ncbi:MAG: hypothetical protein BMS9Abin07_0390 [Acidimicrobiia bacterium]|nr:MAG: hypothetical protein BMS9Abin07_0390 [Acidimicrobiia bacterium]
MSGGRRVALVALLFSAMGFAILPSAALGIMATFIIEDLSISRVMLGWVIAANVVLAAVLSPLSGRIADRIGGKAAIISVLGLAAAGYFVFGIAPAFGVLFVAAGIAAMAQAAANPATNKLIAEDFPPGERGVTTGVKQSGVQAAIMLAGLALPSLAIAFGWRGAMLAVAALPLVAAAAALVVVPRSQRRSRPSMSARGRLPRSITGLAVYGLLFGMAGAATFFVPLFAEESLGLDPRIGGLAITVAAVVAFVARILWARYAERRGEYLGPLRSMAMLGVLASVLLLTSTLWAWLLWPGAIITGASTSSWNSVGMLATIEEVGPALTGRASGRVLLGFLTGLGIGPPLYGATVDATGSYTVMWVIAITAATATAGFVSVWKRQAPDHGRIGPRNTPHRAG